MNFLLSCRCFVVLHHLVTLSVKLKNSFTSKFRLDCVPFQIFCLFQSIAIIDLIRTLVSPIEGKSNQRLQLVSALAQAVPGADASLLQIFVDVSTAGTISLHFNKACLFSFQIYLVVSAKLDMRFTLRNQQIMILT